MKIKKYRVFWMNGNTTVFMFSTNFAIVAIVKLILPYPSKNAKWVCVEVGRK